MLFEDRVDAGRQLAAAMGEFEKAEDAVVIALPRGGVVVGAEIAQALHLPLDIVCPRKIGAPGNPEFAIGAITETGEGILNEETIASLGIPRSYIEAMVAEEAAEAARRLAYYRKGRPPRSLVDKRVIVVDDGIATGSTLHAAIKTIQAEGAAEVIVAVPVAPRDRLPTFEAEVDRVICLATPSPFYAIGQFYTRFDQTTDVQVIALLEEG